MTTHVCRLSAPLGRFGCLWQLSGTPLSKGRPPHPIGSLTLSLSGLLCTTDDSASPTTALCVSNSNVLGKYPNGPSSRERVSRHGQIHRRSNVSVPYLDGLVLYIFVYFQIAFCRNAPRFRHIWMWLGNTVSLSTTSNNNIDRPPVLPQFFKLFSLP